MAAAPHLLGHIDPATFLKDYWQQKPLLVRNVPIDLPELQPDELAGLACETDVESRLVLEKDGPHPWHMESGPFDAERFSTLPASHWTLLVQDVDKFIPRVAELLQHFRFVPDWRIDDIMISYATDKGSVGPHVDHYDVFLLQLQGQRRWEIATSPVDENNYIPDISLNILREFKSEQEWVLEPGDMLYLPPGVAHHGVAQGDCMTCSIGFRAPSYAELLAGFIDDHLAEQDRARFYEDPDRPLPDHPGHLDGHSLSELRAILRLQHVTDDILNDWLGRFLTEPKQHDAVLQLDEALDNNSIEKILQRMPVLVRNPWARLLYTDEDNELVLYAAGQRLALEPELIDIVKWLCDETVYDLGKHFAWRTNPAFLSLLGKLINLGVVLIDEAV
ncbi:MAG: cupin domain-containing protein [Thiohalophilus sp.]|jgi:50S ribosomal protein L16 3-hydroxylase